jgi:hypothetical protein
MMKNFVKVIFSGGQTGADRAALDVARELGFEYGGWIPKGRAAEDGCVPLRYENLRETESADARERTEWNVRDADGTIILSHGRLQGGSLFTQEMARKYGKPCLHVDFNVWSMAEAVERARVWLKENKIAVLNVAGARASEDAEIYRKTKEFLKWVLAK